MPSLDVIKLHTGLQLDHYLEATYLSPTSTTAFTYLIAQDGLPLHVGWFDNSKKSQPCPSAFALTTYPQNPRSIYHRRMLEQQPGVTTKLTLVERDEADYMEGDTNERWVVKSQILRQPQVDAAIRKLSLGAYVVNATAGQQHDAYAHANPYDIPAVREYGEQLMQPDNILAIVDNAMLNRYAYLDAPAFG